MSTAEQPAKSKMKSGLTALVMITCGLIGIVLGIVKMQSGIREIFGSGGDPEVQRLLTESDKKVDNANKVMQDAAPLFQQLMADVDSLGLDAVRQKKQDLAHQISEQFGKAADMLRSAAKELDETAGHKIDDKFKPFLAAKAQSYRLTADACDQNQEIVALVLDKSIAKLDDLLPKIEAVAARRDAAHKAAAEASAKADEASKQAKD
jgi:hypothetical protein